MSILDELATRIEGSLGLKAGRNLFAGYVPGENKNCVVFVSHVPLNKDPYKLDLVRGSFQVIVRCEDPVKGLDLAKEVSDLVTGYGVKTDSYHFRNIIPRHEPFLFPNSGADYREVSVNFDCVFTNIR